MKMLKILTILMVIVSLALPVSAEKPNTDILVEPGSGEKPDAIVGIASVGSVVQGETDYYSFVIG